MKRWLPKPKKILLTLLWWLTLLVVGVVASCVLMAAAVLISMKMYELQHPAPPGYVNFLESSAWDAVSIGDFLGVPLPPDAQELQIEGGKGMEGSYGIMPRLKFSFRSSPQTADTFVQTFCDGRLYPGYNPLVAIDSALPAPDALLIRTAGSIHYSRSPGIPDTVWGNRCTLRGDWSVYEIVIDRSQTNTYTVSFDLPYDVNQNPWEYYPRAEYVTPFDRVYRLFVTGLHEDAPGRYTLTYPTICLITNSLPLTWDYWTFYPEELPDDNGAVVQVWLDGRLQPSAYITRGRRLTPIGSVLDNHSFSNYCLTTDWTTGTHQVRMVITPPTGTERVFKWDFVVKPQSQT